MSPILGHRSLFRSSFTITHYTFVIASVHCLVIIGGESIGFVASSVRMTASPSESIDLGQVLQLPKLQ